MDVHSHRTVQPRRAVQPRPLQGEAAEFEAWLRSEALLGAEAGAMQRKQEGVQQVRMPYHSNPTGVHASTQAVQQVRMPQHKQSNRCACLNTSSPTGAHAPIRAVQQVCMPQHKQSNRCACLNTSSPTEVHAST